MFPDSLLSAFAFPYVRKHYLIAVSGRNCDTANSKHRLKKVLRLGHIAYVAQWNAAESLEYYAVFFLDALVRYPINSIGETFVHHEQKANPSQADNTDSDRERKL